tara:strand:- start:40 stop:318 length:279 start_codon:yes stop_codon:yes gene_type:complete
MALTKTVIDDKIVIETAYRHLQIRENTRIMEDSTELGQFFSRRTIKCGTLDGSDNLVDTDISGEPADIQAIANAAWTTQVKADYKAYLIANK